MATIEERLTKLETKVTRLFTHLNLVEDPIIDPDPPSDLPKPVAEGVVINATNADALIYNPVFLKDGLFTTYVNKAGVMYLAKSPNGLNGWSLTPTNAPYGSIIYADGKWRASAHKWSEGKVNSYYYGSEDGINWAAMASDRSEYSGEDRNMIYDAGMWRQYIRVQPKPRTIGYKESGNPTTGWTPIREVLAPDSIDGPLTQFYQMSVLKTAVGYFGLVTTYRIGDFSQDVEQPPPYTGKEHTTDLQLVFSANGKDNWQRCNSRKNFIERASGISQIYGWWSIIGDQVLIYTGESRRRHTDYENKYNAVGNFFYSSRYKMSVTDLIKYKPA